MWFLNVLNLLCYGVLDEYYVVIIKFFCCCVIKKICIRYFRFGNYVGNLILGNFNYNGNFFSCLNNFIFLVIEKLRS